jgi:hypothetical protein
MASKKLMATAELFLNTKNAKKDAQIFVDDLKQKIADIESAADKMTVFKDMVEYIAQVDKSLAALRERNKDAFNNMFSGLDASLKEQLEKVFGVDSTKLGQLNVLRETLSNLTPKSTIKEIREFAKSLNEIYESVGLNAPFADIENEFKEFNKEAKSKHIEALSSQLANFATVWKNVGTQISKGFGVGGKGFSGLNQEVQDEIDKLKKQEEEIKEIIKAINDPKKVKVQLVQQSDSQVEQLKALKDAFLAASDAKKQLETNKMVGTPEYLSAVSKYVEAAAKVKSAFESTKLTKAGNEWIMAGGLGVLQDADNVLDKFFVQNKDLMNKVSEMYSDQLKNIVGQINALEKPNVVFDDVNINGYVNNSDDIIEDTKETVAAIEYAKKELTKAWQEYYRAAQKAANDYDLILEDGETSLEMDKIKASIDRKIDELGATATNPSKWGVKVDLDLSDAIADGDISAEGIEREIDKLIKQHGISFNIPIEKIQIRENAQSPDEEGIIKHDTTAVIDTIEIAKKQIVNAWEKYYRAVQNAKSQGFDSTEFDPYSMPEDVESAYNAIQAMWDKWGLPNNQKTVLNGMADKINFNEVDFDEIPDVIGSWVEFFEKCGKPLSVAPGALSDSMSQIENTSAELDQAEDKVSDVHTSFQELVDYISQSGISPGNLFNKIEAGARSVDEELKNILQSLGLIKENGDVNLSSIKSGFTNKGGFVSDQYTMIARPIIGPSGQKYLKKSENLQTRLADAKQAGAQIGAIFDIIKDEANGVFYEIQNTVPGAAAFSHQQHDVNKDVLNASDEQFSELIHTIKALTDQKLFIDFGGDNILYDKDKGFSIIDLGLVGDQYHTVSGQNTLQENLDRFIKEYFKFAPKSIHADIQTMLADKLYDVAQGIDSSVVNPNGPSKQSVAKAYDKQTAANIRTEAVAHEQNADAIDAEAAALEALIQLKEKAQNMKWKDFAKDESLAGLKDTAGFTSISQLEKFWKQARYEKDVDFHEISKDEAQKIFNDKLTPGLAHQWYGPAKFAVKDQLENEILQDDEVRNAAMSYMYYLYQHRLSSKYKNPNVKTFDDFLNTEFELYRGDDSPLIYGDESKLSFSWSNSVADGFDGNIGTIKLKPKDTIGNAGSIHESEVETFATNMKNSSWFKETNEAFEDFYSKQTKEMQNEIDAGLVNLEKRRIQDLLDENISKLTHKAVKDVDFQYGALQSFQQGTVPDFLNTSGDGSISDQFANAYNSLSDIDKKLVSYYAALEALSNSLPKQFSELPKSVVGEDAKMLNAVLNDPAGVQKHVAKLTGESQFGILGQNAQDINVEANMHKLNAQAIEKEKQAQEALNQQKEKMTRMWGDVSDKLHSDAEGKDTYLVREISDIWDGAKSVYDTMYAQWADPDMIDIGGYINNKTGEIVKVKDLMNKINSVMSNTGIDLSYVQDYLSEIYKNADLDEIDNMFNSVMGTTSSTDYDTVSNNLKRLVNSKQGGSEEFNMLAHVWHQLKHVDWTSQNGGLDEDINNGEYFSNFSGEKLKVSDLYAFIDEIKDKWGTDLIEVKEYLNHVFAKYNEGLQEGFKLDEDIPLDLDDDDLLLDGFDVEDEPLDLDKLNNAYNEILNQYVLSTGEKSKKLKTLLDHLANIPTTGSEIINDGYIQDAVNGNIDQIEDVYALIEEIQKTYSMNLTDVKESLDKIFATYHGNTSEFAIQSKTVKSKLLDSIQLNKDIDPSDPSDAYDDLIELYDRINELSSALAINYDDGSYVAEYKTEDQSVTDILDLIKKLESQYGENLDYVKSYLQQAFNTTDLDSFYKKEPIDYHSVHDKLYDEYLNVSNTEDKDQKISSLLNNLSDIKSTAKQSINSGEIFSQWSGSSYDVEDVYNLVNEIQSQYHINLDYVKKYLDQVFEDYNKNKIDLNTLSPNFKEEDLDLDDAPEMSAFQSKQYDIKDYEDAYRLQTASAQEAINQMATFYEEYTNLKNTINSEPIEFLISPQNATIDEIKAVQQALDEFKAIQQEITNMPLINTEDDAIKLKDLQAKALGLQNKLKSAELPAYIQDGYDDVFNLSESDAELMNQLVDGPDVNLLNQALDTAYNLHVDKMYDAISDEFSVMIAEDASNSLNEYLLKLGEELKLEKQITAEKEQQQAIEDQVQVTDKPNKKQKTKKVQAEQDTTTGKVVGGDYALESTLQQTNSILNNILSSTNADGKVGSAGTPKSQDVKREEDAKPVDPFKKNLYNKTNSFNKYREDLESVEYVADSLKVELNDLGLELQKITSQDDLDKWSKQFATLQDNVKAAQSVFEQENLGKVNLYQKELTSSFNKLTLPQREELFEEYSEAIILLNKQKQAVKDGHAVELAGIKQITAALQEKINKQIEANKAIKDAEKSQEKNAKFGDTAMINATAKHNSLTQIAQSGQFSNSAEVVNALQAYNQAYVKLKDTKDKLNNLNGEITDSDKETFKELTTECNEYAKALDKLIKNSLKLHNTKANQEDYMLGSDFVDDKDGRIAALTDFAKEMYGVNVASTDFKDTWNKVVFDVNNGDGTFTRMTATFTEARNEIVAMAGDTKKAQGAFGAFFDELKGKFKSIGAYLIASFSFHEVWAVIKQGVSYVREIDSALTELKKVTDETDASYKQFLQNMSRTGREIGATTKDLTTMAAEWARLGYSMQQAGELARSTAVLLNVSEFTDATQASEALISTMQAFGYAADQSMHVVDILNEVGKFIAHR